MPTPVNIPPANDTYRPVRVGPPTTPTPIPTPEPLATSTPLPAKVSPISASAVISVPEVGPITIAGTLLPPLDSNTPEGHVQRGLVSLAAGRLGLALAHFDQALAQRPDWTDARLYRGATRAIGGDMDAAFDDLDRAIKSEPERADAYALRAWAHLRAYMQALRRGEGGNERDISQARDDIFEALKLKPNMTEARSMMALSDIFGASASSETNAEQAVMYFEAAMADLQAIMRQDADAAAGNYLVLLPDFWWALASEKTEPWLSQQVDEANLQLAADPAAYAAYAVRGLARLFLSPDKGRIDEQTLHEAGNDLLYALALMHKHMADLANPAGGPLAVARIGNLQEAACATFTGPFAVQVFLPLQPYPELTQELVGCWFSANVADAPIVYGVAFSPDGTQIATLSESGPSYLRLWDAASGEKLHEVELGQDGMGIATTGGNVAYSPDGTRIAVAYTNPIVRVVDAATGEVVLKIEQDTPVNGIAFSPGGKIIQTMTVDDDVRTYTFWDAKTGGSLGMKIQTTASTATLPPDSPQIVGDTDDVDISKALAILTSSLAAIDGYPATCDAATELLPALRALLGDRQTIEILPTLCGYLPSLNNAPAVSPDGHLLVVPGSPSRVYDLSTNKELFPIATGARSVAFSPDGTRIAAVASNIAGVWDAETGNPVFLAGHRGGVDAVGWSPDGRLLTTGGRDGRFRVWSAETGAELWNGTTTNPWWKATGSREE